MCTLAPSPHHDKGRWSRQCFVVDTCLSRAREFVDTEGAIVEAGDLAQPISKGKFSADDIVADLQALCRRQNKGREQKTDITYYKSAGTAIEDLAGAILIYQQTQNS